MLCKQTPIRILNSPSSIYSVKKQTYTLYKQRAREWVISESFMSHILS